MHTPPDSESGAIVGRAFLEAAGNQLRDNDPPEARQAYERLVSEGHSPEDAKRHIACVLAAEWYDMMKTKRPYDQERYVGRLRRLPVLPWEEDE